MVGILQIAATCSNVAYNVYTYTKEEISASAVHGLRRFAGDLILNGTRVKSVPLRIAMGQLLRFYSHLIRNAI